MNDKLSERIIKLASVNPNANKKIIDPFPEFVQPPQYKKGFLPPEWEEYAEMQCVAHGGFMEWYITPFLAAVCSVLDSTVKVQETPADSDKYRAVADQVIMIGESSTAKTPTKNELLASTVRWNQKLAEAENRRYLTLEESEKRKFTSKALVTTDTTIEALAYTVGTNETLPLTLAPDEAGQGLSDVGAHRKDGGDGIANVFRAGWDCGLYERRRMGSRPIHNPNFRLSAILSATPGWFSNWPHLSDAIENGMMGRISLVTTVPAYRYALNVNRPVKPNVSKKVYDIFDKLKGLSNINVALPEGCAPTFNAYVAAQQSLSAKYMGPNPGYASWLKKNPRRVTQWAMVLALWDHLTGREDLSISSETAGPKYAPTVFQRLQMRTHHLIDAMELLHGFIGPQQNYVYQHVLNQDEIGREVQALTHKLLGREMSEIKRDDIAYGTSTMKAWSRSKVWAENRKVDEVIVRALAYNLIVPKPGARLADSVTPEKAGVFLVTPELHTELAHRKQDSLALVEEKHAQIMAAILRGRE